MSSSDKDVEKEKPLKLPPINKDQLLKRFERTLVGRALLPEVQDQKLGAMIRFLPTVWRCEGSVQGIEMGDGRVHFRFQQEKDLQMVLDNRPYHFDGSMVALDRWVPTVRRDFPNTIPFWVIIHGLPDYRREEETVQSIGEDLGEFELVDVSDPTPRVRVTLECNSPLLQRRETDDAGQLCVLDFKYEKLQRHCSRCFRMTHEVLQCPERALAKQQPRQHHRELKRRNESEDLRERQRSFREDRGRSVRSHRNPRDTSARARTDQASSSRASSSRPKPVRRDILPELDNSQSHTVESLKEKVSTKEWVRKSFAREESREKTAEMRGERDHGGVNRESKKPKAPWYRATEEEAAIDNEIAFQTARWEAVEVQNGPATNVGGNSAAARVEPGPLDSFL
ncbi:hypothetical protein AALP_AA6G252000, partial [Arabis alpina]